MDARRVAILSIVMATGCIEPVDARWELDHDHVVAVRATPPRIMPGEVATLDALVAHADRPTSVEQAAQVTLPTMPTILQGTIGFYGNAWQVTAPSDDVLAEARTLMNVPDGEPVPLDLLLVFRRDAGDPLFVTKTVYLGAVADNPVMPLVRLADDPVPEPPATMELPVGDDVYVSVEAEPSLRVNWLTSCGTLFQDDVARAFVRVDEPASGELAVVIRAPNGGVSWRVFPITAR